jgi:cell shape-determining protein MreC
MPYKPFQPKKEKKMAKKSVFFVVVFLLIVFTVFPTLFRGFSSATNEVSVPLLNAKEETAGGISGFFALFRFKQSLYNQNLALSEKVSDLEQKLAGYEFLIQENMELKNAFFQKREGYVFARVVARPNVTAYDTILIDAGKNAGIKKGAKVFSGETAIIGTIEEVYPDSSKARLFSTAGQMTNVLMGPDNIPLELRGMGGGAFTADVPSGVDIKEGDTALLAEKPDFVVAFVVSKEKTDTGSFQKFHLKSPAGLFNLKYVKVEKIK